MLSKYFLSFAFSQKEVCGLLGGLHVRCVALPTHDMFQRSHFAPGILEGARKRRWDITKAPKTHKICDKKNFFVTKFVFLVKLRLLGEATSRCFAE